MDPTSPTRAAGATHEQGVCVGAWVRGWFPGCTVNPLARGTTHILLILLPVSAVSPWKEQEPVGDNESASQIPEMPAEGFPQLQLQLLLVLCPLSSAHSPGPNCPDSARARSRPLLTTNEPFPLTMTRPAASVLWADGRAVHRSIITGRHCPATRARAVALGLRHGRRPSPRGVASSTWLEMQAWRCSV